MFHQSHFRLSQRKQNQYLKRNKEYVTYTHTYIMICYKKFKKKGILSCESFWMNLEDLMLRKEKSDTKRQVLLDYTCGI